MNKIIKMTAVVTAVVCTGCAELNSIHRVTDHSKGEGKIVAIDAKQRFLVVKEGTGGFGTVTCAEKPPDVFTVLASSLSGGLQVPQGFSADVAAAISETGANIGVRTAAIEALAYELHRICEGYMNRAIDGVQYATLHRRWQNKMVALLAIEQLTGAIRPTPVVIGGRASAVAGAAEGLMKAQDAVDAAVTEEAAAEKSLKDLRTVAAAAEDAALKAEQAASAAEEADAADAASKRDTATASRKEAATAAARVVDAGAVRDAARKKRTDAEANRNALRRSLSASAESRAFFPEPSQTAGGEAAVTKVADTVKEILMEMFKEDNRFDVCEAIVSDPDFVERRVTDYGGRIAIDEAVHRVATLGWCRTLLKSRRS